MSYLGIPAKTRDFTADFTGMIIQLAPLFLAQKGSLLVWTKRFFFWRVSQVISESCFGPWEIFALTSKEFCAVAIPACSSDGLSVPFPCLKGGLELRGAGSCGLNPAWKLQLEVERSLAFFCSAFSSQSARQQGEIPQLLCFGQLAVPNGDVGEVKLF